MTSADRPSSFARNATAVPIGPPPTMSMSRTSGSGVGAATISRPSRSVSLTPSVTASVALVRSGERSPPDEQLIDESRLLGRRSRRLVVHRPHRSIAEIHATHLLQIERSAPSSPEYGNLVTALVNRAIPIESFGDRQCWSVRVVARDQLRRRTRAE